MHTDSGYCKLDEVVRKAIADLQLTTLHKYVFFLHYAIDGLRKLNYNIYPSFKSVVKDMPANKMIPYPRDQVGWIRLGWQLGDRIVAVVHDTTIVRSATNPEDDLPYIPKKYRNTALEPEIERKDYSTLVHGHNDSGYFNDNESKKRFEFSIDTQATEIIIEYVGSCVTPNTETEIPSAAVDFIVSYIHYRETRFKRGAAHAETEATRRENQREAAELKAQLSDLSYDGILQAIQANVSMSTKY